MKDRFRELGLRTAAYARVREAAGVARFARVHGWPVVLKPVDSFACVDTFLLHGPADLREAEPSFGAARRWMVEEYLGGTEWEACALILDGAVLDVWPSAMPCRPLDIVGGAMNANISIGTGPGPTTDTAALIRRIVTGMGIDHGYLHMEFFEIDGRAYAGEVGIRPAGCGSPPTTATPTASTSSAPPSTSTPAAAPRWSTANGGAWAICCCRCPVAARSARSPRAPSCCGCRESSRRSCGWRRGAGHRAPRLAQRVRICAYRGRHLRRGRGPDAGGAGAVLHRGRPGGWPAATGAGRRLLNDGTPGERRPTNHAP